MHHRPEKPVRTASPLDISQRVAMQQGLASRRPPKGALVMPSVSQGICGYIDGGEAPLEDTAPPPGPGILTYMAGTGSWRTKPLPPDWNARRQAILRRDGGRCRCGGCRHHPSAPCANIGAEVDHRIPASEGGGDMLSNLLLLCIPCHRTKTGQEGRGHRPNRGRGPEPHPGNRRLEN